MQILRNADKKRIKKNHLSGTPTSKDIEEVSALSEEFLNLANVLNPQYPKSKLNFPHQFPSCS